MKLKDIFKMEMYKNRNDVPYLVVIAILTGMAAVASILGVFMIENSINQSTLLVLEVILIVFTIIGLSVFFLLYPFHLLNVDYKNRVMSLIFASGVSRGKYYFVKISATILSSLIAILVILLIPIVTFLIVYPDTFVEFVQNVVTSFKSSDIISFVLSAIVGLVASIVTLTTAVIITKGKVSGIFLYFGFSWIVSMLQSFSLIGRIADIGATAVSNYLYTSLILSVIQIVAFVLIGLYVLRKQDL